MKDLFGANRFKESANLRNEITTTLGDKILRGEIDVSSPMYQKTMKTSYQTGGPDKIRALRRAKGIEKNMNLSESRKSKLREEAGWNKNKDGKWDIKEVDVETLNRYADLLTRDNGKGSSSKHKIVDMNIEYNVSTEFQEWAYKELRIKDIDLATDAQINAYTSMIINNFKAPQKEMRTQFDNIIGLANKKLPRFFKILIL